jgi:hypothetical protein
MWHDGRWVMRSARRKIKSLGRSQEDWRSRKKELQPISVEDTGDRASCWPRQEHPRLSVWLGWVYNSRFFSRGTGEVLQAVLAGGRLVADI